MPDLAIYRHEVPVDDCWHEIELTGPIIHVAARRPETVEFWAIHDASLPVTVPSFLVVGTGQPIESWGASKPHRYVGSAVTAGGALVWHLLANGPATVQSALIGTAP